MRGLVFINLYFCIVTDNLKDNFGIFQPGPYFSMCMCVRFMGTIRFKIGSVLREADAAGSREMSIMVDMGANTSGKSLYIKSAFFATVRLRSPA